MIPIPKIQVEIKADHSCNWRCCFGCHCIDKRGKKPSDSDLKAMEVFEKTFEQNQVKKKQD